jgi:transcription elongation factor GreA
MDAARAWRRPHPDGIMLRPMSLLSHVKKGDWEQLEDDWTELMLGDASTAPVLAALPHAARRRELQRFVPYLRDHAELLSKSDRAEEAARLLGAALLAGASPGELGKPLFDAARAAWGHESWWPALAEMSGFVEGAPDVRVAWRTLEQLMAIKDGSAVYHGNGWGIGAIEHVDLELLEVRVRFATGRSDTFPMTTARDIFEVLAADDPRALVVNDPARLASMVREEPLELLGAVVRRHGGQVAYGQLKTTMSMLGVDGSSFSTFWRKARKLADESGWFEITGAGVKVQIKANLIEADPAEALKRQLRRSNSFAAALQRVRDVISGKGVDAELREAALLTLEELADAETRDQPRRLSAWMLLRDERQATPPGLQALLVEANTAEPVGDVPALWDLFGQLPGLREQERAVELLRELRGDAWLDDAARDLVHAPSGMARPLVEALDAAERVEDLRVHYASLLLRPSRNPRLFIALAEHLERLPDGPGIETTELQRLTAMLQLAAHLKRQPASDQFAARARLRLTSLLAEGARPLFPVLVDAAGPDELRRVNSIVERGVDREIDRLFTAIVVERAPEIFRGSERPFWEGDAIWTTREGLARHEEELRILRDVKIPENSEAIGRAASFGDLSENSEWEAAIADQRNLTRRAAEIEAEVRAAALLENAAIPEGTVAPGTRVVYRQDGVDHDVSLLGPWDGAGREDVISYRSPIAQGLLGLRVGTRVTVQLPNGTTEIQVIRVRPLDL